MFIRAVFFKTSALILSFISSIGLLWPVVCIFKKLIQHANRTAGKIECRDKTTILALNPIRFRGDLEILEDTGNFKVLRLPFRWQALLFSIFYGDHITCPNEIFFKPEPGTTLYNSRRNYRKFLACFLPKLYKSLDIDCVIGAAIHYRHDLDWGAVSSGIGIPYIVLHRENLLASESMENYFVSYAKKLNKFEGDEIITQNNIVRQKLININFSNPDHISVCGCLRMDDYVRRANKAAKINNNEISKKRISLFSFVAGISLFGDPTKPYDNWPDNREDGWYDFYENLHIAFAEVAYDNPDIDFVIKTKWENIWIENIKKIIIDAGIDLRNVPNLSIVSDVNPQKLILESDVICGFASTILLEAAIAKKYIVFPLFDEPAQESNKRNVFFGDNLNLFDVAYSVEQFKKLLVDGVCKNHIDSEVMVNRIAYFEKMVSSVEADSVNKYSATIRRVIDRAHEKENMLSVCR